MKYVIHQYRNKRNIRGIMTIGYQESAVIIKLNMIFPQYYTGRKNQGGAKPINEDTKLFAKSIGDEILRILKEYKFKITCV